MCGVDAAPLSGIPMSGMRGSGKQKGAGGGGERREAMVDGVYKCAFCGKKIPGKAEVYGLGARLSEEFKYREAVGRATAVRISAGGREIECMVVADGSQAKLEGWDLIFMVCSEGCGLDLKALLGEEKRLFDEIM